MFLGKYVIHLLSTSNILFFHGSVSEDNFYNNGDFGRLQAGFFSSTIPIPIMSTNATNATTTATTPLPRSSSNSTAAHTVVDSDNTRARTTKEKTENDGGETEADAIIVDWDGPNDPQNPKKCVQDSI